MTLYDQIVAELRANSSQLPDDKIQELAQEIVQQVDDQSALATLPDTVLAKKFVQLSPTIQVMIAENQSSIRDVAQYAFNVVIKQLTDDPRFTIPEQFRTDVYCPYPGLSSFTEKNADFFHGRQAEIDTFLETADRPFIAITGSSGVGKSSFIHAGVLPRLREEYGGHGVYCAFRFTADPNFLSGFTHVLSTWINKDQEQIFSQIISTDSGLADILNEMHFEKSRRVFLLLDQFEGIFVGNDDNKKRDRKRFLDNLDYIHNYSGLDWLTVVIVSRENYFEHEDYRAKKWLVEVIQRANMALEPLSTQQIKLAIEQPVNIFNQRQNENISFQTGLVDLIVRSFDKPGVSLPLVQYLLRLLWTEKHHLTHFHYNSLGGLELVLDRHANDIFERLDESDQMAAESLLLQLVGPGIAHEYTRKRVKLASLLAFKAPDEQKRTKKIIRLLSNEKSRIITERSIDEVIYLELTHEILLRQWGLLRTLIKTHRAVLLEREWLAQKAEQWHNTLVEGEQNGLGNTNFLYNRSELERANRYLMMPSSLQNDLLIRRCVGMSQSYRRRQVVRNLLLVVFLIALVVMGFLLFQRNADAQLTIVQETADANATAQASAEEAQATAQTEVTIQAEIGAKTATDVQARQLANESQIILEQSEHGGKDNITLSILLALESILRTPTIAGEAALIKGLQLHPNILKHLEVDGSVTGLQFTADGSKLIATTWIKSNTSPFDGFNNIFVFDTLSWEVEYEISSTSPRLGTWVIGSSDQPTFLFINDNQSWLGLSNDANTIFYDVNSGEPISQIGNNYGLTDICGSNSEIAILRNNKQAIVYNVLTGSEQFRYEENEGIITSVSIDQAGQQVAIVTTNVIVLRNLISMETLQFPNHDRTNAVAFSPDGQFLALKNESDQFQVWDLLNEDKPFVNMQDGNVSNALTDSDTNRFTVRDMNGNIYQWLRCLSRGIATENVSAVDGQIVVMDSTGNHNALIEYSTADEYSEVQFNNLSNQQTTSVKNYDFVVENAYFSPSSRYLALTGGYRFNLEPYGVSLEAQVFDFQANDIVYRLPHESPVISASFSPSARWIASGDVDGIIRVWEIVTDVNQFVQLQHLNPSGPLGSINRASSSKLDLLSSSSDGRFVATGSSLNFSVKLWNTEAGEPVTEINLQNAVSSIAFSPEGNWIATSERCFQICNGPISVNIWNLHGERIKQISFGPDSQEAKAYFNIDGSRLIIEVDNENLEIWQTNVWQQSLAFSNISQFVISDNGQYMAVAEVNGQYRIFDVNNIRELGQISDVSLLTFGSDGHILASVSNSGFIQLSKLSSQWENTFQIPVQSNIKELKFSSDGYWLLVVQDDDSIAVWNINEQRQVAISKDNGNISSVDFSLDNTQLIITVAEEQILYVWDFMGEEKDVVMQINGNKFSLFEDYLFTADANEISVWSIKTGREISRLQYDGLVLHFIINPDFLIATTDSGSAYISVWSQMALATEACSRLTRNFTQEEWNTYFSNEVYRKTCPNLDG